MGAMKTVPHVRLSRPATAALSRPSMRAPRPALLAIALAAAGCVFAPKERTAGVDDFPNSIYARVDGFLEENKKAEDIDGGAAADSILVRQSLDGPPIKKLAAATAPMAHLSSLAKSAAAQLVPGSAQADGKTAPGGPGGKAVACAGTVTWTEVKPPVGTRVTRDTIIICIDANYLDTIKGNENIVRGKSVTLDTVSGRVEIGEFSDGDGDGIVNPIPGGQSKRLIHMLIIDKGVTDRTRMMIGDGPDDIFETEKDNYIYELSWSRTTAADTLGSASFADADSDGIAVDNGKPSLVDIAWYSKGPTADNKDVVWSRLTMRAVVVYGTEKKDVKGFSIESETKDGRQQSAVLFNLKGGRDFNLGDTLRARFRSVANSPADSLDTMETVILMTAGTDFDAKTDDSTYALNVRSLKKIGEERLAVFDFKSAKPIPSGKDPEIGALTMRVEYVDGTAMEVSGEITDKTVDVTATLRDGKRVHAVWDRSGKGLLLEHLN